MSTSTVMKCCAHCGKPVPNTNDRDAWSIHNVPHNNGAVRTVAVCPTCRVAGAPPENHEPGSCSGYYAGPDTYLARCTEQGCGERWACWDKACVEGWRDEHYVDALDCDCSNCVAGHHDTKLITPGRQR